MADADGSAPSQADVVIEVQGMMCQNNCGKTVQGSLETVPGVVGAEVSFAASLAWVRTLEASVTSQLLIDAVQSVGFSAAVAPDVKLVVQGMMCQKNCGTTVKKALEQVPGVACVEASFAEGCARVWLSEAASKGEHGVKKGAENSESWPGSSEGGGRTTEHGSKFIGDIGDSLTNALECVGFDASIAPNIVLRVDGMMCQKNCGNTVQHALEAVAGVSRAEVSFAEKRARIWAAGRWGTIPASQLVEAVENVGFDALVVPEGDTEEVKSEMSPAISSSPSGLASKEGASLSKLAPDGRGANTGAVDSGNDFALGIFSVAGMSCASCVGNVERFMIGIAGVKEIRVALLAQKAEIRFDPALTSEHALADGITSLGYPSRCITVVSPNEGGAGARNSGPRGVIVVEVTGARSPECVSKAEAAVLELPGVLSCFTTQNNGGVPTAASASSSGGRQSLHTSDINSFLLTVSLSPKPPLPPITTSSSSDDNQAELMVPASSEISLDVDEDHDVAETGSYSSSYNVASRCTGSTVQVDWSGRTHPINGARGGDANGGAKSHWRARGNHRLGKGDCGSSDNAGSVSHNGDSTSALVRGAGASSECGLQAADGSASGELLYRHLDAPVVEVFAAAFDGDGRPKVAGVRDIVEAVQGLGYGARLNGQVESAGSQMEASQSAEATELRHMLILAVGLTVPVMVLHVTGDLSFLSYGIFGGGVSCGMIVAWVLVTLAQVLVGKRFYRNAYKTARHGSYGMDMLVVVGTSVSYLYSTVSLFLACVWASRRGDGSHREMEHPHLFLESPAMLLTFITLGKFLEVLAKRRTSQALVVLLKAQPNRALLVEPGGVSGTSSESESVCEVSGRWKEREIEAMLVEPGDVLRVLPGAKFPTDGTVLSGRTYVDESMISGESSPAVKREGDAVCGGTINQHGSVFMRAERVGEDTMLSQLCRLVEEAQMSKAPIQRHADQVAGVFVPCVIITSMVTFLSWFLAGELGLVPETWLAEERHDPFLFALLFGVSVVVVACPCALGLATPTAVMVGTGVGASNGILIKGGAALEAAHRVNTVIFDKTGTLTLGKPFVTDVVPIASRALMRLMQASSSSTSYAGEEATVVPGSTEASSPLARTAVLAIAAVCESGSEHPIGRSIVDASHSNSTVEITDACDEPSAAGMGDDAPRQLDLGRNLSQESASSAKPGGIVAPGFVSEPGLGVACRHPLGRVCVGTWSWAASNGKRRKVVERGTTRKMTSLWTPEWSHRVADDIMKKLEAQGKTAVLVALDGEAVGVIAVADTVKEGSRTAVLALQAMGVDVWIVTGDNRRVAASIAHRVGVPFERVVSEVLPTQKAHKVEELQARGNFVAMVGDGVNDAPALATADIGIAVGAGTQVAMEAADVVLVSSDVCDVVAALHLSRKVFGRIRINFVFAMIYNIVGVPVAAGALYPLLHLRLPPAVAGFAMALSSISVVLSSLSLRLYSKPVIDKEGRLLERTLLRSASNALIHTWEQLSGFVSGWWALRGLPESERADESSEPSWNMQASRRQAWTSLRSYFEDGQTEEIGRYSLLRTNSGRYRRSPGASKASSVTDLEVGTESRSSQEIDSAMLGRGARNRLPVGDEDDIDGNDESILDGKLELLSSYV